MNLIINTDGASRGNPGPASYGYIIKKSDGVILHQEGKTIGTTTNNVAEYTAVLSALKYVSENLTTENAGLEIQVITDSQLIAKQLSGEYKIKNQNLKKLYEQIKILEFDLGKVSYQNVPRAQNYIADKLANMALDKET